MVGRRKIKKVFIALLGGNALPGLCAGNASRSSQGINKCIVTLKSMLRQAKSGFHFLRNAACSGAPAVLITRWVEGVNA